MGKTYVFLADGFEELEALSPVDLMRRAGVEVVTVSINPGLEVKGAHGVTVKADILLADVSLADADMLVAPGGMPGAQNLHDCPGVRDLFGLQNDKGGHIAAICAAPAVLLAAIGLLDGREATCYPGFEGMLAEGGAKPVDARVVKDGNIITANGPSSAIPFALALVAELKGQAAADQIAAGILL